MTLKCAYCGKSMHWNAYCEQYFIAPGEMYSKTFCSEKCKKKSELAFSNLLKIITEELENDTERP